MKRPNRTKLSAHERRGKRLIPPMHADSSSIGHLLRHSSWKDEYIPRYLWALVVHRYYGRKSAIPVFWGVLNRMRSQHKKSEKEYFFDHLSIAHYSDEDFQIIFGDLFFDKGLRKRLNSVACLISIPGAGRWRSPPFVEPGTDFNDLAEAILLAFDHQSEAATDVRWLIVMSMLGNDRLSVPEESFNRLMDYPGKDEAEQRLSGASVRATEIALRMPAIADASHESSSSSYAIAFWEEVFNRTDCIIPKLKFRKQKTNIPIAKECVEVYGKVALHFFKGRVRTDIDQRREGAFGLVLYALSLFMDSMSIRSFEFNSNRLLLRSCVEACINLKFLAVNDNEEAWTQFRNYSSGQYKLNLLKYIDANDFPDFVDIGDIEMLANEDYWMEYVDINLGPWANKSLRDIAVQANAKDLYDKYYGFLSISSHAQWGAIRETNFQICLNPLHRFHRVPHVPMPFPESTIFDFGEIINVMLDTLGVLYPGMRKRLTKHRSFRSNKLPTEQRG